MARIKQLDQPSPLKPLITWTRFFLPHDQEWPVWAVEHENPHVGPLVGHFTRNPRLARMVDDTEQAVYIIEWETAEKFKRFQSSPDYTIFLNGLPESKDAAAAAASQVGAQLEQLTLVDDSTSAPPPPAESRFLLCRHSTERATRKLDGLVTITAFLIPNQSDLREPTAHCALLRTLEDLYRHWPIYQPLRDFSVPLRGVMSRAFATIWLFVLEEDAWVTEKFGPPSLQQQQGLLQRQDGEEEEEEEQQQQQQTQQGISSRAVIYHVFNWKEYFEEPYEAEAMAAEDTETKEDWERYASRIMPPATAWLQERWDIRDIPVFEPPEIEEGSDWE